jgi:hypothetical protein
VLDVVDQLRLYGAVVGEAVPPSTEHGAPRDPGRRSFLVAAGTLLLGGVGGAIWLVEHGRDRDSRTFGHGSARETPSSSTDEWSTFPGGPIEARVGSAGIATDAELLVWGGWDDGPHGDGAAYAFETGDWRLLAPSPLSPRDRPIGVWTEGEAIFWGGEDLSGELLVDGAAYDPVADSWRVLPSAPFGAARSTTAVAWTGDELILSGVRSVTGDALESDTFALEPRSGSWRPLTPSPLAGDQARRGISAVWTGAVMLVVSISDGVPVMIDTLTVEPEGPGTWDAAVETALPGTDTDPLAVAWGDDTLVVLGHYRDGVAYRPANQELTRLPPSESTLRFPAVVVGAVVSVGDRWLGLDVLEWTDAAVPPDPPREFPVVVAHSNAMFVWGGSACPATASCGDVVDPEVGLIWRSPSS